MSERRRLKNLVQSGDYRPDPERVAEAMLRRRSVRTLLVESAISSVGRIQPVATGVRRAA